VTTVVYSRSEKVIAYDSRQTRGEHIVTDDYEKAEVIDGVTFIFLGSTCDFKALAQMYLGKPPCKQPEHLKDSNAVVIDNGKIYYIGVNADADGGDELVITPVTVSTAWGSGYAFAIGAMDAGFEAVEAVHVAIGRDVWSGGKVRTISL